MAQNIYDRTDFFEAYMEHIDRSSKEAELDKDPAWTRLHPLLPPVAGLDVLDLGCGSGWFCRWAANNGARSVLGVDISANMLGKARELTDAGGKPEHAAIEYRQADLETLELPAADSNKYGLVFSSLALHYLADVRRAMALVERVLAPGALFVFNVEHPVYTAPHAPKVIEHGGKQYWALDGYYQEGERVVDWLAPGLRKYHRTMTGYFDAIFAAGFEVAGLVEWFPTEEELKDGTVDEDEALRPLFLMMSVRKRQ